MSNLPAAPLTLKTAIETITTSNPDAAAVINAAIRKDILVLGTDEAFALRDSSGEIKAFKQSLTLSTNAGTLVQIPGGGCVISAQGYEVWAEATGASVVFPKEVLVDGQWQQNPAVVRDPQNRRILCIYARAVAFRYSSKGIPQVSDWTTCFDTPSYRLIDLLGKAKAYPHAFRLLPVELGAPKDDGTWAGYPFDESTSLWVNTAHNEALTWFAQILNREKKAIDFAQTFAKRNALKHLSGLQAAPVLEYKTSEWKGKDGKQHKKQTPVYADTWTIPVLCWRHTGNNIIKWDMTQYSNLQDKVTGAISGADFNTDQEQPRCIEHKTGRERVSDEEGYEDLERETDPEDQEPIDITPAAPSEPVAQDPKPEPEKAKRTTKAEPALSESGQKIMANYREAKEMFPEEHLSVCLALKLDPRAEPPPADAALIISKINAMLDNSFGEG
jgi:hypothetical protein